MSRAMVTLRETSRNHLLNKIFDLTVTGEVEISANALARALDSAAQTKNAYFWTAQITFVAVQVFPVLILL